MSQNAAGALAASVGYTYNADDQLSAVTSASGTVYNLTYGAFGHVCAVKAGTQTLASYTYTTDGNYYLKKLTYGNGQYYNNAYDAYGRVTSRTYNDSAKVTYLYDGAGNLGRTVYTPLNQTTKYYYDLQQRPVGYDVTGTNASSVRWGYDIRSNLTSQKYTYGGSAYTVKYTYDTDDRVTKVADGTRNSVYTYDAYGRIAGLVVNKSSTAMVTTAVTYKNPSSTTTTSRVATWKNTPTGGSAVTYTYAYDNRGNITSVAAGGKTTTYVYDGRDQLLRENNETLGKTWVYTYDAGGNVLTKKQYAYTTGTLGTAESSVTYTYGNSQWKDVLTKVGGTTITSDAAGNVTSDGTWTYTWQHGRELAAASKTGTSVSYTYNEDGQRQSKTVDGVTYSYNYIGGTLYDMTWGSDKLHFTYDAAGPSTVTYNGTVYYYLRNATGDVMGITDADGTKVVGYIYDAWGALKRTSGSMASTLGAYNPLRYRGYVYDTETELYYLNSRYYNPNWGRFISADSFVSTGQGINGYNMFAYCNNNPVNCTDDGGDMAVGALGCSNPEYMLFAAGVGAIIVPGILTGLTDIFSNLFASKKTETAKTEEIDIAITKQSNPTVIYRYGGTSPSNLTPKPKDRYTGLSFSTEPRSGAAMTTIEAINATGILEAVRDGMTHVSVRPKAGTMDEWINAGSSSIWTQAVKSVVVKWS